MNNFCLKARSENGYGFLRSRLKTGLDRGKWHFLVWNRKPGGTTPPKIFGSTLSSEIVPKKSAMMRMIWRSHEIEALVQTVYPYAWASNSSLSGRLWLSNPSPPGTAKMSSAGVFDRYKVVPYIRIYLSRHAIFREAREPSCVKGFWEIIRLASQKDLTKGGKIISYPASNDKDFQHAHWEKPIDRISVEFPEKNQHSFPNNPFTVVLCSLILQRCIRNYYSLLLYSRNSNVNAPPRVKGGGGGKGTQGKFW